MSDLAKPLTEKPEPPELWSTIAIIAGLITAATSAYCWHHSARWKYAEAARTGWQPIAAQIEQVATRYKKGIHEIYSGRYEINGQLYQFRTDEFHDRELSRTAGRELREKSVVTLHVNPTNHSESVFEAAAQSELFRIKTNKERFVATLGGLLCLLGIVLHRRDKRRFNKKSQT